MRIAVGVEYQGTSFNGWQIQEPSVPTVQAAVEAALSKVADHPVRVFCAGRTDTGVHAAGQVLHFDTASRRQTKAWVLGTNAHLPTGIAVTWAHETSGEFHARFSALSRRYCYLIANTPVRGQLFARHTTHEYRPLDVSRMRQGAKALIGELDFSSFRSAHCQSPTAMRCVTDISIERRGDLVCIQVEANAFLHHMVRNIAGVLMDVGAGKYDPGWVEELLELRDRSRGSRTAPPEGLYLVEVRYPARFGLPSTAGNLPLFS